MGGDLTYGFPKPSRVARMNEKEDRRREREREEKAAKAESRRRDGNRCRFPLCGCQRKHRRLESAHVVDKSRGGPNVAANIWTTCADRHQDSVWSIHKKTIEVVPLSSAGADGPMAFRIDCSGVAGMGTEVPRHLTCVDGWVTVARETSPGVLEPLESWQTAILEGLARMLQ